MSLKLLFIILKINFKFDVKSVRRSKSVVKKYNNRSVVLNYNDNSKS